MTNSDALVLGDLELAVLTELWIAKTLDAKSAHARLAGKHTTSLQTVQSTLERLFRKRLLRRLKVSHAYQYEPAVTRYELISQLVESATCRLWDGADDARLHTLLALIAVADVSQLARLQAAIVQRLGALGAVQDAENQAAP